MSEQEAWERALESIGRVGEAVERVEKGQHDLGAAVLQVDRKLEQHMGDDDRRFDHLRRKDALIAAKVEGVKVPYRSPLESQHDLEVTKVKEENTTKRWSIAASIVAGVLALAGSLLLGRATAPTPPSVPYAVPAPPPSVSP